MLAPLENRSVLTVRGCDEECAVERELHDMRRALRAARLRLRRSAVQSTRRILALTAEVEHLQKICERQSVQIARYASGTVVVDLGRRLMELSLANERLIEEARRAAVLERALGMSEAERQRLLRERDAMACELVRHRHDAALGLAFACRGDPGTRDLPEGGRHVA